MSSQSDSSSPRAAPTSLFIERWRDALMWLRLPSHISLSSGPPHNISGLLGLRNETDVLALLDLQIKRARWWRSWAGLSMLIATVRISDKPHETAMCVGSEARLSIFKAQVQRVIRVALAEQENALASFAETVEMDRVPLFNASRYVRYSQLQFLLSKHHPAFTEELKKKFSLWSQHPLRARTQQANTLIQRWATAITLLTEPESVRQQHNADFVSSQSLAEARYFAAVKSSPLTAEQVEASLSFDDANVTVAAAGSGKTSVIVSKVGYAIKAGLFSDGDILVLAYNAAAASELRARIRESLGSQLGRPVHVEARTFHSLGLRLSLSHRSRTGTAATQPRPKIIQFDEGAGKRLLAKLLLDLTGDATHSAFTSALLQWAVDHRFPAPTLAPSNTGTLEDRERRYETMCKRISRGSRRDKPWLPAIPTFDPSVFVRSNEEARIANWLYLRDVDFDYERKAPKWITGKINEALSEEMHVSDYKPDFTYPNPSDENKRFFHEHFGLNANGQAPGFLGPEYVARAAHKRQVLHHALKRDEVAGVPRFFETQSAQFSDGTLFEHLAKQLRLRGISVGPLNTQRRDRALQELVESDSLIGLIAEFVSKFRDSGLTFADLELRARQLDAANRLRATTFLGWMRIYMAELEVAMAAGFKQPKGKIAHPLIDYAGMVSGAVQLLRQSSRPLTNYKLILVDEFQDISRLRAQLVQGLLDQHPADSVLFCVGDDWQAINRFAGADVQIFRTTYNGLRAEPPAASATPIVRRSTDTRTLKKTFRCAQGIADVARWFVMRPNAGTHIDKKVEATNSATQGVVRVVEHVNAPDARLASLRAELQRIADMHRGRMPAERLIEVFVLTRNRRDASLPEGLSAAMFVSLANEFLPLGLDLAHTSLHGSKGLGRDYVIIAGMDAGRRGYPRDVDQDPLIEILLPPQKSAIEEERRLFYVGLTRAKRQVTLLCAADQPSAFVHELEQYPGIGVIQFVRMSGFHRTLCPHCKSGWLTTKDRTQAIHCSREPHCGFVGLAEKHLAGSSKTSSSKTA